LVESFDGETFVAFIDICGFKHMMRNPEQAEKALDNFFRTVYREVSRSEELNSIAVSDSAIIFAGDNGSHANRDRGELIDFRRLGSILECVRSIARRMIRLNIAIKGSIAYGQLHYQKRRNGDRVVKAMLLGQAYLDAYSDVEEGIPKLKLGEIRLIPKTKIKELLKISPAPSVMSLLKSGKGGYYFYWMLKSIEEQKKFKNAYKTQYNKMYDPTISVLKNFASERTY